MADGDYAAAIERGAPAVVAEGVSKSFVVPRERHTSIKERLAHGLASVETERFDALRDVDLRVQRGEFLGIVGRNGSGKSTLMRVVAGIYEADRGSVTVRGRLSPFIELGVGFKPDLSGRDNVILNCMLLGLSRREIGRRFDSIVAFAELEDFMEMKLKDYSSGMSARLAFSIATQVEADVVLIDEVLAVGDASFQEKCFEQFERLKQEGRTVLFVTHDMRAVVEHCDRAVLLDAGEVVEQGTPELVARRYDEVNVRSLEARRRTESEQASVRASRGQAPPARSPAFSGPTDPTRYRPSTVGDDLRSFVRLTVTLAQTSVRLHYQDSVLGYLWSVLRPLAFFAVLYLILSRVAGFGDGVEHYPIYLLSSIVLWTFFVEAVSEGVPSLVGNSGLLRKARFPTLAIPLGFSLKALFNLAMNMLAVAVFFILGGVEPRVSWLELPFLVLVLALLATGLSVMLSALFVRFRDVGQVWEVTQRLLFYGSPILFVASSYPEAVRETLSLSPLSVIFTEMRHAMLDPSAPSAAESVGGAGLLVVPAALVLVTLAAGFWVFKRETPRIAERI